MCTGRFGPFSQSKIMLQLSSHTTINERAGKRLSVCVCMLYLSIGLSIMVHYLSLLDRTLYHHGDKDLYSACFCEGVCVCVWKREKEQDDWFLPFSSLPTDLAVNSLKIQYIAVEFFNCNYECFEQHKQAANYSHTLGICQKFHRHLIKIKLTAWISVTSCLRKCFCHMGELTL